ncbi:cation transporter [Rhodovibrio salinarum]|uniref:Cation transporter n=1 Tax=Rhodovibrio salinarum TaxID=1087 RepID=A0A934QKI8_9PROT|nr:cation transporter [Rhodovibrio salinarum]MBK1698843.1 cation transporter [Rhodovibrio salinarum]
MTGCSCGSDVTFDGLSTRYKRVLWLVIALNAGMFGVEMAAGLAGQSMALKADALDFLGDTATYALSLAVIGGAATTRARVALFKGVSLGVLGLVVLTATLYRVIVLGQPDAFVMTGIGVLACTVNVIAALLLLRYRDGDANVRSVWLCSRNDAIGNTAVVLAGLGVFASGTPWPDLAVAGVMAGLFFSSATGIVRQALGELRDGRTVRAPAA